MKNKIMIELKNQNLNMGCWGAESDKIKVTWLDGSTSKLFDSSNMVALGDIQVAPKPASAQSKAKKTHLTCDADGWSMEVDVERGETGDLSDVSVCETNRGT